MLDFDADILRQIEVPPYDYKEGLKPGDAVFLRRAPQSFGKVIGFVKLAEGVNPAKLWGTRERVYIRTAAAKQGAPPGWKTVARPWRCRQVPYSTEIFSEISNTKVEGWPATTTWSGTGEMVVVKHFLVRGHKLRVHHQSILIKFASFLNWELRRVGYMQRKMIRAESLTR